MTQSPFTLPPGPERRQRMLDQHMNPGEDDFTPEELQEISDHGADLMAAYDRMVERD